MWEKGLWAGREHRAHSRGLLREQSPNLLSLARLRPRMLYSPLLPPAALKKRFRNTLEPDPCRHQMLPPVEAPAVAHRPGSASPDSSTDSTTRTQPRGVLRTLQGGPWGKL